MSLGDYSPVTHANKTRTHTHTQRKIMFKFALYVLVSLMTYKNTSFRKGCQNSAPTRSHPNNLIEPIHVHKLAQKKSSLANTQ